MKETTKTQKIIWPSGHPLCWLALHMAWRIFTRLTVIDPFTMLDRSQYRLAGIRRRLGPPFNPKLSNPKWATLGPQLPLPSDAVELNRNHISITHFMFQWNLLALVNVCGRNSHGQVIITSWPWQEMRWCQTKWLILYDFGKGERKS